MSELGPNWEYGWLLGYLRNNKHPIDFDKVLPHLNNLAKYARNQENHKIHLNTNSNDEYNDEFWDEKEIDI